MGIARGEKRRGGRMPTVDIDYMMVGYASTFRVPVSSFRKSELPPGTKVLLLGDGVDDQFGVVDCWFPENQVQITVLPS
jgi:hypothetical protein